MEQSTETQSVPVILVGRSPVEQSLRRDPAIELVRAPGMLNAIGELAALPEGEGVAPIVVFGADAQRSGDLDRCIDSLRVVDTRVRIVGVVVRNNGSAAPECNPRIKSWINERASGEELRASVEHVEGEQVAPVTQTPVEQVRSPVGPDLAEQQDESDIIETLLSGDDVIESCLGALRRRLDTPGVSFAAGADAPRVSPGFVSVPVDHGGHCFGWMVGPENVAHELGDAGAWLGKWIALERQQAQLRRAALTDPLTGAWNRRYFDRFLERAIARARRNRRELSLLVFDLDNFKSFNDRYGHGAGDEILRETVRLLGSVIRPSDRVARLGGDEFAVIFDCPDGPRDPASTGALSIYDITRRFQQQINEHRFPKLGDEAKGNLTISGGLATFPWDASDAEALAEAADQLILSSKAQGKDLICIGPGAQRAIDGEDRSNPDQTSLSDESE